MKYAFLFPGQGTQHPGMGAKLVQEYPYVKNIFIEANDILQFDILDLCSFGREEDLNMTANAQPAILLVSYCAFCIVLRESGVRPFLMAGHSLGEISALCCSGAIRFPDALRIVRKRGELMQSALGAGNGAMLAITGIPIDEVRQLCGSGLAKGRAVISNINSREQTVVSGDAESVDAVGDRARRLGATILSLKVSAPFHSPLMQPAATGLETELNCYTFSELQYPVLSNVTCKPYMNEHEIIPLLTKQVTSVVNWLKIMEYITKTRVCSTLELPPKKTLTRLFNSQKAAITSYAFDQFEELKNLSTAVA